MDEMNKDIESIPDLESRIAKLQEAISDIERPGQPSLDILNKLDNLNEYKVELAVCQDKLKKIPSQLTNYFLENGELLYNYNQQTNTPQKVESFTISDILKKKTNIIPDRGSAKSYFFQQYRANVDPDYINIADYIINDDNYCYNCKQFRILVATESTMICEKCGQETIVIIGPDKLSLKDPPAETHCYKYMRFGHFCDWLANLQGKESNEIPEEVIETIISEIKRERLYDRLDQVSEETIKKYLKKHAKKKVGNIKYDKYYEHAVQILFKITGIPPLSMTAEMEQNLKFMFLKIQEPFERHRNDRSNFISYAYVIYKFCQLLGDDDPEYRVFAKKLKLRKSKEKIRDDDLTWKKICKDLGGAETGWKFIPST